MKPRKNLTVAVAVLAAGGSSRMGTCKQLILLDGETLVHRAARRARRSAAARVLVVVGAEAGGVVDAVSDLRVEIVENRGWVEGIGSSIAAAARAIRSDESIDAILFTLADQPSITSSMIDRLIAEAQSFSIVASAYADGPGVPALFRKVHFDALAGMGGDRGARSLIVSDEEAKILSFDRELDDIDQPEDLDRYLS